MLINLKGIESGRKLIARHIVLSGGAVTAANEIALVLTSNSTSHRVKPGVVYNAIIANGFDAHVTVLALILLLLWFVVTCARRCCCACASLLPWKQKSE